ncbi:MAG: FtsQ-type POTRA domain-containing protein [Deltaproteobacteria bacterium]|nr:FtsQ-type POTRA domain-containing protein [Deltaproteobacteria bacterium]
MTVRKAAGKTVKNRRRAQVGLWARVPGPRQIALGSARIANACGRMVRRSLPAIGAGVAVLALGVGAVFGYRFVTTSDRFAVTEIQIHGTSRVDAADLRAALPVRVGDNVFTASLGDITRAVRAQPWIAGVEARRVLPHTIVIDVREHEPSGVVALDDALYLVDAGGTPFKRVDAAAGDGAGLPIVTGISRTELRSDPKGTAAAIASAIVTVARWRADPARPAVGEAHLDAHRALTLRTYDGAVAIGIGPLGGSDAELAARIDAFDAAWAELEEPLRARARHIHIDARPTVASPHVTIAFVTRSS